MERIFLPDGSTEVEEFGGKVHMIVPQNLSDLAWAYAELGLVHPALIHELSVRCMKGMHAFSRTCIVDCAWAFASLSKLHPPAYHPELFRCGA